MPWGVQNRPRGTLFDDLPGVQHGDSVGTGPDHRQIVADEQQREAVPLDEVAEEVDDPGLGGGPSPVVGLPASARAIMTR